MWCIFIPFDMDDVVLDVGGIELVDIALSKFKHRILLPRSMVRRYKLKLKI